VQNSLKNRTSDVRKGVKSGSIIAGTDGGLRLNQSCRQSNGFERFSDFLYIRASSFFWIGLLKSLCFNREFALWYRAVV